MKTEFNYTEVSLDLDLQLLASEMETKVSSLVFLSNLYVTDFVEKERFDSMWEALKERPSLNSLDDETELYELDEIIVATHETLEDKFIICENKELHLMKSILAVI